MTQSPPAAPEPAAEIACPFCASAETELFAMFSQFLLACQYYCRGCRTVFDVVRWEERARAAPAGGEAAPRSGPRSPQGGAAGEQAG